MRYSLDNGASWTLISGQATGTSLNWTVPGVSSSQAKIRVNALDGQGSFLALDESDSVFSIETPPVQVISPNGGETLTAGATVAVDWTAQAGAAHYVVRYSLDNGVSWTVLTNSATGTSYNWDVPNVSSSQAKVRVNALDGQGSFLALDESDAPFSIAIPATFAVTAPNGGETLTAGTDTTISWDAKDGAASYVVRYSLDNGSTWTILSVNETGTSYNWSVPMAATSQGLVRVNALNAQGGFMDMDTSDAPFSIGMPMTFAVTAPNGGETLTAGADTTITWDAKDGAANYVVRYSTDNGSSWTILSVNETGTSYSWNVPMTSTSQGLVRVNALNAQGGFMDMDVSDAPFNIGMPTTFAVTAPNGGETLTAGADMTITWDAKAGAANYVVRYSTDNGSSWTILSVNATGTSFSWDVPMTTTSQGLVRVNALNAQGGFMDMDVSDAPFSIAIPATFAVTAPNGGETLTGGASTTITWNAKDGAAKYVVRYSTDNGLSWTILSANETGTSYSWEVPMTTTSQGLVRVNALNAQGGFMDMDVSDDTFVIQ